MPASNFSPWSVLLTLSLSTLTIALKNCNPGQRPTVDNPCVPNNLPYNEVPAPIVPAPESDGVPDVVIKSNCDFPIYLREIVAGTENNPIHPFGPDGEDIVIAPGEVWTSEYYWPNLGVSIKLSRDPWVAGQDQPLITQVEYTYEPETQNLWYDLSDIDCFDTEYPGEHGKDCPFFEDGVLLRSEPECRILKCFPDDDDCQDAYIHPKDDWETKCCTGKPVHLFADLCAKNAADRDFMNVADGQNPEARYHSEMEDEAVH